MGSKKVSRKRGADPERRQKSFNKICFGKFLPESLENWLFVRENNGGVP